MATANLEKDKIILTLLENRIIKVHRNGRVYNALGQVLKGWTDQDGYNRITVRLKGIQYHLRRHRIV